MNKNLLRAGVAAGIIAAIVIAVKLSGNKSDTPMGTPTPSASALPTAKVTPKPTATASPTAMPTPTPTATATPTSSHYQNTYLAIDVPAGWTLTESTNPQVSAQHAVSITKGNWILYINAAASQASGVEGGRFDEYAGGAPGVETVMGGLERPRGATQCAQIFATEGAATIMGTSVARHDFRTMVGGDAACHIPSNGNTAWFLAIVGAHAGFNSVDTVTSKSMTPAPNDFPVRQFAITMTYSAATADGLPRAGTPELAAALAQMDNIVSTLVFR